MSWGSRTEKLLRLACSPSLSDALSAMLQRSIKWFSSPSRALIFHSSQNRVVSGPCSRFRKEGTDMFVAKLIGWYRMWSRYERGVRELSQLSDRELADIGVTRSEIAAIAWHDAHR